MEDVLGLKLGLDWFELGLTGLENLEVSGSCDN